MSDLPKKYEVLTDTYIISTILNGGQVFYLDPVYNGYYGHWSGEISEATSYPTLDDAIESYNKITQMAANINDSGEMDVLDNLEISKIKIIAENIDRNDERLLFKRREAVLRQLSAQKISDLGLEEMAVEHRLSFDEEKEDFFVKKESKKKYRDDSDSYF